MSRRAREIASSILLLAIVYLVLTRPRPAPLVIVVDQRRPSPLSLLEEPGGLFSYMADGRKPAVYESPAITDLEPGHAEP